MSNTLNDLNAHLFAQLDRLGNTNLKDDEIETEVKRASAMVSVSKELISSGRLQMEAVKFKVEHTGWRPGDMPAALTGPKGS